ncbi:MAG: hypothetical protein GY740_10505 [Gammaproteobacteria bacterium]|nr:hypothetical protein [Gammaproteobacteria bacterium]
MITLQCSSFKGSLLSTTLSNSSYVYLSFYQAGILSAILQQVQRNTHPGCPRNLLPRVVQFLRKEGYTHCIIDTVRQKIWTGLFRGYLRLVKTAADDCI